MTKLYLVRMVIKVCHVICILLRYLVHEHLFQYFSCFFLQYFEIDDKLKFTNNDASLETESRASL